MRPVLVVLPRDAVRRIRAHVRKGTADSVSHFVRHAVGLTLEDIDAYCEAMRAALRETGGDLTAQEIAWADEALGLCRREERASLPERVRRAVGVRACAGRGGRRGRRRARSGGRR